MYDSGDEKDICVVIATSGGGKDGFQDVEAGDEGVDDAEERGVSRRGVGGEQGFMGSEPERRAQNKHLKSIDCWRSPGTAKTWWVWIKNLLETKVGRP